METQLVLFLTSISVQVYREERPHLNLSQIRASPTGSLFFTKQSRPHGNVFRWKYCTVTAVRLYSNSVLGPRNGLFWKRFRSGKTVSCVWWDSFDTLYYFFMQLHSTSNAYLHSLAYSFLLLVVLLNPINLFLHINWTLCSLSSFVWTQTCFIVLKHRLQMLIYQLNLLERCCGFPKRTSSKVCHYKTKPAFWLRGLNLWVFAVCGRQFGVLSLCSQSRRRSCFERWFHEPVEAP